MNDLWSGIITVASAIVGVAIVAVIVSKQAQSGSVITSATGGFAKALGAAISPITGSGGMTGGSVSSYPMMGA